ncbi:hypothetical protein PG985_004859 [Apiospora marii]|uniref:uncharacterized protein n=1 Tax=Apiospora marii TaxID=335849 RepID=UPI0031320F0D
MQILFEEASKRLAGCLGKASKNKNRARFPVIFEDSELTIAVLVLPPNSQYATVVWQIADAADEAMPSEPILHQIPVQVTRNDKRALQAQPAPASQPSSSQLKGGARRTQGKSSGVGDSSKSHKRSSGG